MHDFTDQPYDYWLESIEPGPPAPTKEEVALAEAIGTFLEECDDSPLTWRLAGLHDALMGEPRQDGYGRFQPDYDQGYALVTPLFTPQEA